MDHSKFVRDHVFKMCRKKGLNIRDSRDVAVECVDSYNKNITGTAPLVFKKAEKMIKRMQGDGLGNE